MAATCSSREPDGLRNCHRREFCAATPHPHPPRPLVALTPEEPDASSGRGLARAHRDERCGLAISTTSRTEARSERLARRPRTGPTGPRPGRAAGRRSGTPRTGCDGRAGIRNAPQPGAFPPHEHSPFRRHIDRDSSREIRRLTFDPASPSPAESIGMWWTPRKLHAMRLRQKRAAEPRPAARGHQNPPGPSARPDELRGHARGGPMDRREPATPPTDRTTPH